MRSVSFCLALGCWGLAAISAVPTMHGIAAVTAMAPLLWVLRITAKREGRRK